MKDSVHCQKSSSIVSDLKAVSSVINSRKRKVFLYGFVFTFVVCTTYLAFFNPSGGAGYGTPWFSNLFSTAASSTAPYRSQISNFFSRLRPNSTSLSLPEEGIQAGRNGAPAGRNGVTREGIRFHPGGDARNESVEELKFKPKNDQSLETRNEGDAGSQESEVSGTNRARTKSVTGNGKLTKIDSSLKQSESTTSTGTPPVSTSVPEKEDRTTKKQSDTGNHAASGTPATQEVKKESGSRKDGNDKKMQKHNGTAIKNQSSNGSHKSSPASTSPVSTVPATSSESPNQITTAGSPPGYGTAITKSQSNSTSQNSSALSPSGNKNASPDRKDQNQLSSSQAAIDSKRSETTTSSQNYTASLARGNEGVKGVPKKAPNTDLSKNNDLIKSMIGCDMFQGQWVRDDSYPLYPEGSCPHIDEPFDCYHNGRPDRSYQKLRWQPRGCTIPRFNAIDMLERLRGKRLVFIGDSLNRNMWESLVCALRHSVKDKLKVFEASGRHEFRTEGSYSFLFTNYNCSVEFFRSPFLVQEWEMPTGNSTKKETLRIDLIERSSPKYKDADVLVFNTGHWWTHEKTSQGKDYYQEGNHVYSELNVLDAFHKALSTWAKWIDTNVNPKKTLVLFRGYSASHFSGGQWNSGGACDKETEPIKDDKYLAMYPTIMNTLEDVINSMKTPVVYLNITRMSDYRKDAHPSIYRKQNLTEEERRSPERYQDCSHWCLPGVPDSWNELLYAQLLVKQYLMSGK